MSLVIRKIEKSDYKEVEILTREAFWNVYRPGCSEHLVVHNIHNDEKSIEELELIAEHGNKIVGHIVYTKGHIENIDNKNFAAFGPISVLPEYQNKDIGSKLIKISLQKAKRLGFSAVFITGNEKYYNRFGFESASKYNIYLEGIPAEDQAPFFMVRCLEENALEGVSGYFAFDDCYNINEEELEEFDKGFDEKKKEVKEGQLGF